MHGGMFSQLLADTIHTLSMVGIQKSPLEALKKTALGEGVGEVLGRPLGRERGRN